MYNYLQEAVVSYSNGEYLYAIVLLKEGLKTMNNRMSYEKIETYELIFKSYYALVKDYCDSASKMKNQGNYNQAGDEYTTAQNYCVEGLVYEVLARGNSEQLDALLQEIKQGQRDLNQEVYNSRNKK